MDDCIFCNIIAGGIPANFVHRDDDVAAISDVNPQAPTHVLVMPVLHSANLTGFTNGAGPELPAKLLRVAAEIGARAGGSGGYRIVINTGPDAGQSVDHLHVHVLAGRPMHWPPG